jgi:hypothetical protein
MITQIARYIDNALVGGGQYAVAGVAITSRRRNMKLTLTCCAVVLSLVCTVRADLSESLKTGAMDIKQAGPMAFGPDGVLFIGDTQQGAIYAVATGDSSGDPSSVKINVAGIDQKIAAMLGTTASDILINDVAVNPASGNAYLSVSRGKGAEAAPAVIKVDGAGKISEVKLSEAKFSKAAFNNVPGGGNQRGQSITDIAYAGGKVIVAGLSNEEFASKLRTLEFPFKEADRGASVEIYHGAHGAVETRSPVRTFVTLDVSGEPTVLAAYTCTPLVTFPMANLKNGEKVTGKTVAELGAGNTPLDIITYKKDGKEYLLVTNTRHGVLKLSTDGIADVAPITNKVRGTAGMKFENISDLKNVKQLDKLNGKSAVLLVSAEGSSELKTIALP